MNIDPIDKAVDMLAALTNRLLQEQNLPPEVIARLLVGGAVHLLINNRADGAIVAAELLRQSADQWEELRTSIPHAELH